MKEKSIKHIIQNGWRSLILHPFFYNGITSFFLLIQAFSIGLLNFEDPFSSINCFNIAVLLLALVGLFLSYKSKGNQIVLYAGSLLAIVLPAVNILFNAADLRLSIFALPTAYLYGLGNTCHALKSKLHGIFSVILLVGLILPMTQPNIVIDENSIGIQIILIAIVAFTALIFFILYSWHKMKSFLLVNEKQLIDKIGSVVDVFSNILIKEDDIRTVLANVVDKIIPSLEFQDCVIYLLDDETKVLVQESVSGSKSTPDVKEIVNPIIIPLGKGITGAVALTGIPEIISDTSKDKRYFKDGVHNYSEMCVPIIANNKVIGVIDSEHASKNFFNEIHLYMMQIIAVQCASKITEIRHRNIYEQSAQLEMESKKLQETNLSKSRFISNLSHDLKTPLTLILGPAKELTKRDLTTQQLGLVRLINENGILLKQIIDGLLALNEMNFLSQNSTVKTIDFDLLMTNWLDNFVYRYQQKDITSQTLGSTNIELHIDEKKLSTVIINLLDYTLDSTPVGGEIVINYGVHKNAFLWEIEGSGVDHPKETTDKELSITKQLINSMGGIMTIVSSGLGGIKIKFQLPLNNKAVSETEESDFLSELKSTDSEKPILLIIEDHDDLRQFIHQSLEAEFICVSSENGEKGLEMAKKFIPDLVITDLMLPGISGEEVCAEIRNDEKLNHIPIVVLSAKSMALDRVELYRLGAENYLTKPFEIEELTAIIRNNIQQRRNLKAAFQTNFISEEEIEIQDPFIQKIIGIIEKNLSNNQLNISTLMNEIKIGRNQLQRKIKMLTDMTPIEFMRNVRLKKAYKFLLQGQLSISEIAFAVGFNNLSYFTRSFKRAFDQLPSEVLEKNKSK